MNWLFSKQKQTNDHRPKATVESIRNKLADYQPSEGPSRFEGPSMVELQDFFEFEKVSVDPDANYMPQATPFSC